MATARGQGVALFDHGIDLRGVRKIEDIVQRIRVAT
jgi:hypothetical protein